MDVPRTLTNTLAGLRGDVPLVPPQASGPALVSSHWIPSRTPFMDLFTTGNLDGLSMPATRRMVALPREPSRGGSQGKQAAHQSDEVQIDALYYYGALYYSCLCPIIALSKTCMQ